MTQEDTIRGGYLWESPWAVRVVIALHTDLDFVLVDYLGYFREGNMTRQIIINGEYKQVFTHHELKTYFEEKKWMCLGQASTYLKKELGWT